MADLHRTFRGGSRVKTQRHLLADQGSIHFIDHAVEADGAILLHLTLGLEEKQIVQIQFRCGEMHVPGAEGPLFQRRVPLEPTMRCMVVLAFQPDL